MFPRRTCRIHPLRTLLAGVIACCVISATLGWCAAEEDGGEALPDEAARAAAAQQFKLTERILRNTAEARDKLGGADTSPATQQQQQDVVDDLEALIDLLKKSPPPPPKKSDSSSSNSSSDSQDQQQNSSSESEAKSARNSKSKGSGAGRNREQPQDSEERHGEARDAKQRADRKHRLENDIWGHLPPALREQLLNTYGERMLPQYEEYVRKFYEALSEPGRTKKR